jgi:hypothetical protein
LASGDGSVGANTGGLFGNGHIIGLSEGTDISYDPTVLDGWSDAGSANHSQPGSLDPSLGAVSPAASIVFNNGSVATSTWVAPSQAAIDAVSAVLMHSALDNEYITATDLFAGTDWVVTFPTKRFHLASRLRPFTRLFTGPGTTSPGTTTALNSCDVVTPTIFGREEEQKVGSIDFSPEPAGSTTTLCMETNVIRFGTNASADVLKSLAYPTGLARTIASTDIFTNGWMRLTFTPSGTVTNFADIVPTVGTTIGDGVFDGFEDNTAPNTTMVHQLFDDGVIQNGTGFKYIGLPAIGFAAIRYSAGNGSALAGYGASYNHKGERLIPSIQVGP